MVAPNSFLIKKKTYFRIPLLQIGSNNSFVNSAPRITWEPAHQPVKLRVPVASWLWLVT